MKRTTTLNFILFLLLIINGSIAIAATLNVPAQYSTIQAGLSAASANDTVLVQPGTYTENITWPSVQGIKLISAGDSSNTIINGNAAGRVLYFSGTALDTTTIVKGFTLRNGLNTSSWYGAGIYFTNAGSPLIIETAITDNRGQGTRTYGAGVTISNSSPVFRNVSIRRNIAATPATCNYHYGGGVYCDGSNSTFTNVIIADNVQETCSRTYGTGMYVSNSNLKLTNVLIANNVMKGTTFRNGGGIDCSTSNIIITNTTITGNYHASGTSINGTGINISHSGGLPGKITMINTISWNTQGGTELFGFSGSTDSITVSYSDINGGWVGTGNINLDPLFVSTTDFKLQNSSPCIDAGTATGAPSKDLANVLRVSAPDIGAYENVNTTGIEQMNTEASSFVIFPNPVSSQVTISIKDLNSGTLKIINTLGQTVFSKAFEPTMNKELSVSFENYPAGFYSVVYETAENVICKKVIKE